MISNILAQLFRVGFIFGLIACIVSFTTQVMNKPIRFNMGSGGTLTIGNAGLKVKAQRSDINEHLAPDSIINFRVTDSNHFVISSGTESINSRKHNHGVRSPFEELIRAKMKAGEKMEIDTVIHMIGQQHPFEMVPVDMKSGVVSPGTFRDHFLKMFYPVNEITQEGGITEQLRIMPATGWQRAGFVLYDFVKNACYVLLMLFLSRLFFHFSKQNFFTAENIRLINRTGWLLLIPTAATQIMYYGFLMNLHPVKLVLAGETDTAVVASYEILANTDWTMVFLGVGLLVLSIIFKDGLKMKEEEEFTL